jgi:hypothetical protein
LGLLSIRRKRGSNRGTDLDLEPMLTLKAACSGVPMESLSQRAMRDATCPNRFPPPAAVRRASQGNRDRRFSRQANCGQGNEQTGSWGASEFGAKECTARKSGPGCRNPCVSVYRLPHRNRLPPNSLAQNSLALFPTARNSLAGHSLAPLAR